MAPPPPPELIEELVEEVLLRFPPDDPASLVRAALVCKLWCRLVCGTTFRRRFREFHRGAAPLLGVLYTTTGGDRRHSQVTDDDDDTASADDDSDSDTDDDRPVKRARVLREPTASFVPTTSCRPAAADGRCRNGWRAIDAHHGRVLLSRHRSHPRSRRLSLSVWDPITDEQRNLPEVPLHTLGYSAAVTCAAAGGNCCDHLDCHQGPFLVVAIDVQARIIILSVYSSEDDAWSNPTIYHHPNPGSLGTMKHTPGIVLIGTSLYFLSRFSNEIVEFDLATQQAVCTIDLPPKFYPPPLSEERGIVLMTGEDGELGFAIASSTTYQLELWSLVTGGDGRFVQTRVIDLHKVLPSDLLINSSIIQVNGFANGGASRFLFMRTSDGLYSIEVNSSHVRKVANCCDDDEGDDDDNDVVPYISFCTPTSKYNFASTVSDDSAGASPDARPTMAMVEDSQGDALQNIMPRRPRTKNPRFYGPEWANK